MSPASARPAVAVHNKHNKPTTHPSLSSPPSSSIPSSAAPTTPAPKKTVRFQTTPVQDFESHGSSSGNSFSSTTNFSLASILSRSSTGDDASSEDADRRGGSGGGGSGSRNGIGILAHVAEKNKCMEVVRPTLLQPRVAVVLGLPRIWHLPLFACRLLSVGPAIWWSLGILIRLFMQLHALAVASASYVNPDVDGNGSGSGSSSTGGHGLSLESRLKLTETALAMVWCAASAYLSFFFIDCLMSRWLLNYTPQATIVRLLAMNALNGYLTSWVIYLAGSGGDSRLLLPAWVSIAATLTGLYHATQRKINIRKETSISISVFSGASFISMVTLLAQLYWDRPEYADVPVVAIGRRLFTEAARIVGNLFDIGNIAMDL